MRHRSLGTVGASVIGLNLMLASCAAPSTEAEKASATSTKHTAHEEQAADGSCTVLLAWLDDLASVSDGLDAGEIAAEVEDLSARLAAAASDIDRIVADQAALLEMDLWDLAGAFSQLATARERADAATVELLDDVVATTPPFLRSLADRYAVAAMMPGAVAACPIATVSSTSTAWVRFADAVAAFAETETGERAVFAALVDIASSMTEADERMTAGPTSGMDAAFEDCARDLSAMAAGDNAGCDELFEACRAGEMLACNDLYWVSALESEYESFAATCGRREESEGFRYAGFCEERER